VTGRTFMKADRIRYPLSRWWGWGDLSKTYPLDGRRTFLPFLKKSLDLSRFETLPQPSMDAIPVPDSRIRPNVLNEIAAVVGQSGLSTAKEDRLRHATGRSYRDLLALRLGNVPNPPDAVVFPQAEQEVAAIVAFASRHHLSVIPVGGGTSVVGGIEPAGPSPNGSISLNLMRMNHILDVNRQDLTVSAECGIPGPQLEEALNTLGLTLGHFPESFEFSTLGGWMASASSGQDSTLYGDMADMVLGLRIVCPTGVIETPPFPAHAQGPDLKRLFLGSEGTLGVMTRATLRVQRLPGKTDWMSVLFRDFLAGTEATRQIIQIGLRPAVIRVSDGWETQMAFALAPEPHPAWLKTISRMGFSLLLRKGFAEHRRALMIVAFEGSARLVMAQKREARRIARRLGGFCLGGMPGRLWNRGRFEQPYLRDELMNMGLMVDTMETVVRWTDLERLYRSVRSTLLETMAGLGTKGMVLAHLSHPYPSGSGVYFILVCPMLRGSENDQWRKLKDAATSAILQSGGALSHHHGIGLDYAPWMVQCLGKPYLDLLRKLKMAVDPYNIMNPGKLLPELGQIPNDPEGNH
jgi:alkyldihydroxyacetonephosphate synthase